MPAKYVTDAGISIVSIVALKKQPSDTALQLLG